MSTEETVGYRLYYNLTPKVWANFDNARSEDEAIDMATKSMAHRPMDDIAWLYRTFGPWTDPTREELVKCINGGRPWPRISGG